MTPVELSHIKLPALIISSPLGVSFPLDFFTFYIPFHHYTHLTSSIASTGSISISSVLLFLGVCAYTLCI